MRHIAAASVLLLLLGPAQAATIADISPKFARLDALQNFTVTGTGLSNVSIPDCVIQNRNVTPPADTSTRVTFSCVPSISGAKTVLVDGVPMPGAKVVLDHPARLGSAAARGLPQVGGVSLWNGNFNLQATDMAVPGRGPAFTLSRSYNSYFWEREKARGAVDNYKPWRFNWERRIGYVTGLPGVPANSQIFVQQADGSSRTFFKHSSGEWLPLDQGNFDKLVFNAASLTAAASVSVFGRDGLTTTFESPDVLPKQGRLISVSDALGQKLVVSSFDANNKPLVVTDTNGLRYSFKWAGERLLFVTDGMGRQVEYTWECGLGSPAQPARACGPGVEDQQRLKAVKDLRGKVTTFVYEHYESMLPTNEAGVRYQPEKPIGARTFLSTVVDPRLNPVVQLKYKATAYGNWGVASVANGENETWSFGYCAQTAAGACPADTSTAVRFTTTVTPPLGPVRLSYFDTSGRPAGGTDGRGNSSAAKSFDTLATDATTYAKAGLPAERQSPRAVKDGYRNATYSYDEAGRGVQGVLGLLTKLADAKNNASLTAWAAADAARNLFCPASRTTPEGLASTTGRDAFCRVQAQSNPGQPASTLAYAKTGFPSRPTLVAGPRQDNTQLDYDTTGNLNKVVGPMLETTTSTYDRWQRVIRQINPLLGTTLTKYACDTVPRANPANGAVTPIQRCDTNLVETVTDPLGRITENAYDDAGNLSARKAPNGQVTNYIYDKANRLIETRTTVAAAAGPQIISNKTVYDALGRVKQTINANSHASTSTFDDGGNVTARANALGQATSYEYDEDNRVTKVTDAAGRVTETSYDELGRVTAVTTPAGTQSYDYDGDGRVTRHVDARNNVTRYRYHPTQGHLIEVTDARNQITSAEYDEAGNVVAITDPNRNTTRFEFDKSNRRTKRTDPNGHIWTWEYDAAGNVRFARAPGGLVTEYVYDTASQLKQTRLPDGQTIAYDYDANGNRIKMTDATGVTQYVYDGINRLVQITDPRGKVLKYAYDPGGNRTAITYPNNKVVGYTFDAAERLVAVTDWLGKTHSYTLNAAGQVTQLALGNGTKATMVYDAASRLKSLVNSGPANAVISSHTLQMDGEGNITEAAVQLPLLPSFGSSTKTMVYDVANRLKSVDGAAVVHDDAGRLTAMGGEGYAYDARDLLTTITGPNAATYTYNGAGHRVVKTVGGTTTRYVIDPNASLFNVVAENDGNNALLRSYIHGYGLLMQISAADVPRYYHYDPTGHTLALTDAGGVVTDKYAYTPYGETTASGTSANPFRFVGKFGVADEGNGLHYMRKRYYSFHAGRLLGLDALEGSILSPKALNRYSYVSGNPVSRIDPSGLKEYSLHEGARDAFVNTSTVILDSLTATKKGGIGFQNLEVPSASSIGKFGPVLDGLKSLAEIGGVAYQKAQQGADVGEGRKAILEATVKSMSSVAQTFAVNHVCVLLAIGAALPTAGYGGLAVGATCGVGSAALVDFSGRVTGGMSDLEAHMLWTRNDAMNEFYSSKAKLDAAADIERVCQQANSSGYTDACDSIKSDYRQQGLY